MSKFSPELQLSKGAIIEFGVPSWHINAHGPDCQADFGLGFQDGVGRTCGEEVESTWARTNPLGPSTWEMGPGAHHETLNDQWGGLNFQRILVFCQEFLCHLKKAVVMHEKHQQLFDQFSATFQPATITAWQAMINIWKEDHSKPNLYLEPGQSSTTLQDVRLELAKEDSTSAALGEVATHEISLTTFLTTGLELEEWQCIITYDIKVLKKYKTQTQLADLEEKQRTLMMHINLWREVQLAYLPSTGYLVTVVYTNLLSEVQSSKESLTAEAIPLFLLSSLLPNQQPSLAFAKCLLCEVRLRIAQAEDALADIWHYLHLISGFWQFKKVNISGTGNCPNTRMRTLFNWFNHHIKLSMLCYSVAHTCLLAADPMGEWNSRLKELKKSDV
ncbi:hypothetical protein L208DRAFT_1053501, partial [Tricholoma matsutake]